MDSAAEVDGVLVDLLVVSQAIGVARFEPLSGRVQRPSPTFTRLTGIPHGRLLATSVAEAQRPALAALVAAADVRQTEGL